MGRTVPTWRGRVEQEIEMLVPYRRALSEEEYRCFLKSYNTHIQFNETERELFPQVMEFMYLDEVIWLLANDSAGWKKESSQCRYLLDMISLGTNLNRYSLD